MSNNETLTRSIYGSFHFPFVSDAFCIKEIRAPFSDGEVVPRACPTKIVLLRVVFSSNVTGVVAVSADGERK